MPSANPTRRDAPSAASRRERQIMDIVYRLGSATAAEIHDEIEDPPTYTTIRGLLRILVVKGVLKIERDKARYVYSPTVGRSSAGASMLDHVVQTFFGGSPYRAINALLGTGDVRLSKAELERIQRLANALEAKDE